VKQGFVFKLQRGEGGEGRVQRARLYLPEQREAWRLHHVACRSSDMFCRRNGWKITGFRRLVIYSLGKKKKSSHLSVAQSSVVCWTMNDRGRGSN